MYVRGFKLLAAVSIQANGSDDSSFRTAGSEPPKRNAGRGQSAASRLLGPGGRWVSAAMTQRLGAETSLSFKWTNRDSVLPLNHFRIQNCINLNLKLYFLSTRPRFFSLFPVFFDVTCSLLLPFPSFLSLWHHYVSSCCSSCFGQQREVTDHKQGCVQSTLFHFKDQRTIVRIKIFLFIRIQHKTLSSTFNKYANTINNKITYFENKAI